MTEQPHADDPYDSMKGGVSDADEFARRPETDHFAEEDARRGSEPFETTRPESLADAPVSPSRHGYNPGDYQPGHADAITEQFELEPSGTPPHGDTCRHCRGTGVMSTNDLLRESLTLLAGNEDPVIRTFYAHLLRVAPDVAAIFPPDLVDPMSPASADGVRKTGRGQRDLLVAALVGIAHQFNPDDPSALAELDRKAELWGRRHAAFTWPDGSVSSATPEQYAAVKSTLFATLHEAAGSAWLPAYDKAWTAAYDRVATRMQNAAIDYLDQNPDAFGRMVRR